MLFHSSIRKELARTFGATLVVLITIVMTIILIRTLGQASRGTVNPSEVMMVMGFSVLGYLPVLLTLMCRAGIVTPEGLAEKRRYAVVGMFIVAAVLTPPDVISQLSLAVPLMILYEGAIWSVKMVERKAPHAAAAATAAAPSSGAAE